MQVVTMSTLTKIDREKERGKAMATIELIDEMDDAEAEVDRNTVESHKASKAIHELELSKLESERDVAHKKEDIQEACERILLN